MVITPRPFTHDPRPAYGKEPEMFEGASATQHCFGMAVYAFGCSWGSVGRQLDEPLYFKQGLLVHIHRRTDLARTVGRGCKQRCRVWRLWPNMPDQLALRVCTLVLFIFCAA